MCGIQAIKWGVGDIENEILVALILFNNFQV
jgi:hypothetical protein